MPRDENQVTSLPLIDSMHSSLARYGATLQLVEQLPAMVAADSIAQHSMAQHSKHGPAQHSVASTAQATHCMPALQLNALGLADCMSLIPKGRHVMDAE